MDKSSITGRSDSLFSILQALIRSNSYHHNPSQAADRIGAVPPSFAPFLANQKLAEFFAAQGDLSLKAVTATLFPPGEAPQEFVFEPDERMMSEAEKEVCIAAVSKAIREGTCIYGNEMETLEARLAEFLGVKHVLLCASGTAALMVALFALGLEPGDEVIMPANSFASTENAVLSLRGVPVLVDVQPDTHNLDPEKIEAAITSRTKVILPVDLYGRSADLATIHNVAKKNGLVVLEDACQAIGVDGVGQGAAAATLSFNTFKNFSACGKAGAILTNDEAMACRCTLYAYHGFDPEDKHRKIAPFGLNSRIDNLQAAALLARLPFLSLVNFRRLLLAYRYSEAFQELHREGHVFPPPLVPAHSWYLYTIVLRDQQSRDGLATFLQKSKVPCKIIYPILTHQQETPWRDKLYREVSLGVTEDLQSRKLTLPLFNGLQLPEQDRVIDAIHDFFTK
jgi:3-dehydro-glucose-6-phosphate--glutamate transaminase